MRQSADKNESYQQMMTKNEGDQKRLKREVEAMNLEILGYNQRMQDIDKRYFETEETNKKKWVLQQDKYII